MNLTVGSGAALRGLLMATTATTAYCAASFAPAYAQEGAQNDKAEKAGIETIADPTELRIETIVVTAERREEGSQDVPISMTVFSSEFIKDYISDPYEVANLTANYAVNSVGGALTSSAASIRGLGSAEAPGPVASSSILTYYDGVAADTPFASTLPQWDLSRIEVLRGPQGTLYGRNAVGGAIQYVSAMPTEEFEGYGEVTLGAFDLRRFEGAVSGPITETLAGRISFLSYDRAGDVDNTFLDSKLGEREWWGVRGIFDWRPTNKFSARIKAQHFEADVDMIEPNVAPSSLIDPGQVAWLATLGVDPDQSLNTNFKEVQYPLIDPYNTVDFTLAEIDLNYDFGPVALTAVGGFMDGEHAFNNSPFTIPAPFTDQVNFSELRQWSGEVRLTSQTESSLQWIAGSYYQHTSDTLSNAFDISALFRDADADGLTRHNGDSPEDALDGIIPLFPASNIFFDGGANSRALETYAFFLHTTYNWTDRLTTTHAVRFTHESQDMDYAFANYMEFPVSAGVIPGTLAEHNDFLRFAGLSHAQRRQQALSIILDPNTLDADGNVIPFNLSDSWDVVTWRFAADYSLTDNALLYASVSRGFKGGRFTTLTNVGGALAADPETSTVFEIGGKTEWFNNRLRANASVFFNNHRDLQTNVTIINPDGTIVNQLGNLPKVEIYGGELEITAVPVENLLISANLGVLESEITEVLPGDEALLGNTTPYAEELNFSGLARYDLETSIGVFSPQVSGRYWGEYWSRKENNDYRMLGGFWTVDLRLGYESRSSGLYGLLYVKNLTDEVQPLFNAVVGLAGANGSVSERRNWGAKVGYRF